MEQDKISVIIPVHNGAKYIRKTAKGILDQDYRNIELILVENFSKDNSLELCNQIAENDSRVKVFQSFEKGINLARKKGIEAATGKYILFSDVDDSYINNSSIRGMYNAIVEDGTQICQFGYYKKSQIGLKRKVSAVNTVTFLSRAEIFEYQIKGICSSTSTDISVQVWNKIYETQLLKTVIKNMTYSLFYPEDMYINILSFCNSIIQKVSVRPESYYIYRTGIGISSSSGYGFNLLKEYNYVKGDAVKLLKKNEADDSVLYAVYIEVLYLYLLIIKEMIENRQIMNDILEKITEIEDFQIVKEAKAYFNGLDKEKLYDELSFMSSDYTPEEYYNFVFNKVNSQSFKVKINNKIKKVIKKII